jgi:hypothetical protein
MKQFLKYLLTVEFYPTIAKCSTLDNRTSWQKLNKVNYLAFGTFYALTNSG